ncbi:hypothetical protein JCM10450v2_001106 [Rhodotorula kratochvilovae]
MSVSVPLLDCSAPSSPPRALDTLRFPHSAAFLPALTAQLAAHAQFRDALLAAHASAPPAPGRRKPPQQADVARFLDGGLALAVIRCPASDAPPPPVAGRQCVCVGVELLQALEEEARAQWTSRLETLHLLSTVVLLHALSRAFGTFLASSSSSSSSSHKRSPSAPLPGPSAGAAGSAAEWAVERAMMGGWILLELRAGERGLAAAEGVFLRSAAGSETKLEESRIRDWQSHLVTALALNLPFPSPHLTFSSSAASKARSAPPASEGRTREPVVHCLAGAQAQAQAQIASRTLPARLRTPTAGREATEMQSRRRTVFGTAV